MAIDPDLEPILEELRARDEAFRTAEAAFVLADQELAARIKALEERPAGEDGDVPSATVLDALKAVQDSITTYAARITAVETWQRDKDAQIAAVHARVREWLAESAPTDSAPVNPDPVPLPVDDLPTGYRMVQDFGIDKSLTYDWGNEALNIYLPNWVGGDQSIGGSWGEPRLLTYNADKTVTLNAAFESGKWRNGAFQFNQPLKAKGNWGAIVSADQANAVHAFFTYASNSKELDFELVKHNGVIGWAPAVHMPKTGGGTGHSNKRTLALGEFKPGVAQRLEINLLDDRCEFSVDGKVFETVTPADMSDGTIWDTTTRMAIICSVERHGGWAGWTEADYAKGSSQTVHALLV